MLRTLRDFAVFVMLGLSFALGVVSCCGCSPMEVNGTQKVDGKIKHDIDVNIHPFGGGRKNRQPQKEQRQ